MGYGFGAMTPQLFGALIGLIAFAGLSLYVLVGVLRRVDSRAVLLASVLTTFWVALQAYGDAPLLMALMELAAYGGWMLVLGRIMGVDVARASLRGEGASLVWVLLAGVVALVVCAALVVAQGPAVGTSAGRYIEAESGVLLSHLAVTILAIGLLDQVRGNVHTDHRWRVKYLALGLFVIFGYDFILYTDALLFQGLDPTLATIRPAVHALAAPLIAIAVRRHRQKRLALSLSRRLAFQSAALMAAGGYLVLIAAAGYYVRLFGGQWGEVLQAFFVAAGSVAFLVVVGSRDLRERLRKMVASNFFEQRYDYREEWQRLTRALAGGDPSEAMEVKALRVLSELLNTPGGAIWTRHADGQFLALTQRGTGWIEPLPPARVEALRAWFRQDESILDAADVRGHPEAYPGLDERNALPDQAGARFVLPLLLEDELWGMAVLLEPTIPTSLDWEDRDLMRLVARQTASFLAQRLASDALAESRQLDAFNQMNAFVVHDVKTVVSQLSLLVGNADRHRDKPAFVDDVIRTTRHAVERMEKLLKQLRERRIDETERATHLRQVCDTALERFKDARPRPILASVVETVEFVAPHDQLVEVVSHLMQNAVDATPETGRIELKIEIDPPWQRLIIEDTGCGMSERFVQERLFAPFESTKGLTAMGIGVYQARQLIRGLGGDLLVRSKEGEGTRMEILLPAFGQDAADAGTVATC
ncbi:MAG: PEP-CTERM system histidine kinase PrsK [Gammaproteobacteria bacterium]|nr:MAG: PEP-CTERM system histidine kinase PrsK [Gammaproteobacteria bacterium]